MDEKARKKAMRESFKRSIIELKNAIAFEKNNKKRDNEDYDRMIKGEKDSKIKARHREAKKNRAAQHDTTIAGYKRSIAAYQFEMKNRWS